MINIDELQAGPELDALIAERVMDWKWCDGRSTAGQSFWETSDGEVGCFDFFEPSTDIAAAWKVVGRLVELGYSVSIYRDAGDPQSKCSVWHYMKKWEHLVEEWCETAPLAICRAALKTVE